MKTILRKQIGAAVQQGNDGEIARCSALLGKLTELSTAYDRIEAQVLEIEKSLVIAGPRERPDAGVEDVLSILRAGKKAPPSTLEITIDWARNGQPFGLETISDSFAADALVKFLDSLYKVLGSRVIVTASGLRVSRGPFISNNPRRDYWNSSTNEPYQFREWREGYSILTNTETRQKAEDVKQLLGALNFIPGSFTVRQIPRKNAA